MRVTACTSYVEFLYKAFFTRNFVELRWCSEVLVQIPVKRHPVRFLNVGLCFIGFVFEGFFLTFFQVSNILLLGSDKCLGLD